MYSNDVNTLEVEFHLKCLFELNFDKQSPLSAREIATKSGGQQRFVQWIHSPDLFISRCRAHARASTMDSIVHARFARMDRMLTLKAANPPKEER